MEAINKSNHELELIAEWQDKEQRIVGFYTQQEDGHFCIKDIRSRGFSELRYTDDGEIVINVEEITNLPLNKYYEFSWTTENDDSNRGFHIVPKDYLFQELQAKQLVQSLYDIWATKDYDTIRQMFQIQNMVNTQLTASSDGTFIYELLQNANDYPEIRDSQEQFVDVEFHITNHYLIYRHTGRVFSPRNIAAISKMSDGEKRKEKNAIGYKGIGFKTVFSENRYVYLRSGEFSLRFDKGITEDPSNSSKLPWQLMPVWTPQDELDTEVIDAMAGFHEFRVQMAIRPNDLNKLRDDKKSFEAILKDIFQDEKDILFIPKIKSVKVFYDGKEQISRTKDPNKWVLTEEPLVYIFSNDEIEDNNREVLSNKRIPEKYRDFEDTRVSFACRREGRIIKPVDKARIYCYLPTQVSLGFPFLMNTDMIPTGPRDDFEKGVNLNHKIMKIAGGKFAEWISNLLHGGNFDLCSIFSIIPTFEKIENYEDFIGEFQDGFNSRLENLEIIPCENGAFSIISDTIIDDTGLLSSGIISDEKFLELSNFEGSLPAIELREDDNFKTFVKKYIKPSNVFDKNSLRNLIHHTEFQNWLKNQENNNKFLKFLLDNGYLQDFLGEQIFIDEVKGELHIASDLYYDIDEELEDLFAFKSHLCYLSLETRKAFKDNEKWNEVIREEFKTFRESHFITKTLLEDHWDETYNALKERDTSFHFYNFLAKKGIVPDRLSDLPFFDDDSNIVTDFRDKFVFLSSQKGKEICSAQWLSSVTFAFVSQEYDEKVLDYFQEHAGVKEYSDNIIVEDIILSEDYLSGINKSQQKNYPDSKDFVRFCYEHSDLFAEGSLKEFALNAFNRDEEESFETYDAPIFFPSEYYDDFSKKKWINSDWMYRLNSDYLSIDSEESVVKAFLETAFKIKELTADTFYTEIVRPHLTEIFKNTSGNINSDGSKNFDFIKYLDDNYTLIFEDETDAKLFSGLVIASNKGIDVNINTANLYLYDKELADIIGLPWFPDRIFTMAHPSYGESKSLKRLGVACYSFSAFYDAIIVGNLSSINNLISTVDESVEFHNFIIKHTSSLTAEQVAKMKNAKVFLYGDETHSVKATGHNILSQKAKELFELGLVECKSLDLIAQKYDPDANIEYWGTRLENSKFTLGNFASWLKSHRSEFETTLLKDKTKNIAFWRWLKNNQSESLLNEAIGLPLLLSNGNIVQSGMIYFSDAYLGESEFESRVRRFNNAAHFLSPSYIEDGEDVAQWKDFFSKVEVKYEIVAILIDTIDNRLSETKDASLIRLITNNREALESHYTNELVKHLHNLRVQAKDGKFYNLSNVVYVDCEKSEPFKFIEISNQVSFDTPDERSLIIDILHKINGTRIEKLTEWQRIKISRYRDIQSRYRDIQSNECREELLRVHYRFIDELASIYAEDKDRLKEFDNLTTVLFLDSEGKFVSANTLTLGSIYKPFCDFERFGLDYQYLSDTYKRECKNDIRKMLNKIFGIHCDFKKSDIPNLKERDFAIYFWSEYLLKQDADIHGVAKLIEDGEFDEFACIPTKDYVKKPCELYYGSTVSDYLEKIEDRENKTPLVSIPEIELSDKSTLFSKLKFKNALNFLDALDALFDVKKKKNRKQLIDWMIVDYDSKYDTIIKQYKASAAALWFNSKGEESQIAELYALEYGNPKLEQYFSSNPKIIDKSYFPIGESGESFKKACDILRIKTLTDADFEFNPKDATLCEQYKSDLDLFSLIIAGITNIENWEKLYSEYHQKLESLQLFSCCEIHFECKYDQSINRNFTTFYHNNDNSDFYFVGDIHRGSVFSYFVDELKKYLNIYHIANDLIDHLLESRENAERYIKKEAKLLSNDSFRSKLIAIAPEIKDKLQAPLKVDEDEDVTPITRPTFTTSTATQQDEIADSEDNDVAGVSSEEDFSTSPDKPETSNVFREDSINIQNPESHSTGSHTRQDSLSALPQETDDQSYTTQSNDNIESSNNLITANAQSQAEIDTINHNPDNSTHTATTTHCSSDTPINHGLSRGSQRSFGDYCEPRTSQDIERLKSKGVTRCLLEEDASPIEIEHLNTLLGSNMSAEDIVNTHYLVRMRLYQYLRDKGLEPLENEADFIKSKSNKHQLTSGKYIHPCSATYGIVYISPSIWNQVANGLCVVCVYIGKRTKDFIILQSTEDILKWVHEDDILIKLTGEEKMKVVKALYSGVLDGITGTAYTLIRVASNAAYNSIFASLRDNPDQLDSVDEI